MAFRGWLTEGKSGRKRSSCQITGRDLLDTSNELRPLREQALAFALWTSRRREKGLLQSIALELPIVESS